MRHGVKRLRMPHRLTASSFSGCGSLVIRGYETFVVERTVVPGLHVAFTVVFESVRVSFALPAVKVIVPVFSAVHVPIVIGDCGMRKRAGMPFCSVTGPYEMGGLAAFTVPGLASVALMSNVVASIVTPVMPFPISASTTLLGIVTCACHPLIETGVPGLTSDGVVPLSVTGQIWLRRDMESLQE